MGPAPSKIEEDKALVLCHERRRFVKEALDGRCALAAAHFAYIQSLRHTGFALRKFVEPEVPAESSLYTSTSATPEPLALEHKSRSQFLNLSPSVSQHVDTSDSFSPVPSPLSSGRFHINHMNADRNSVTTVEEKLPVPVTATLQSSSPARRRPISELDDSSTFEAPPEWDYFDLFHPVENPFSFHEEKELVQGFDNADDIRRLREEEGIPELEEEGEKSSANGRDDDFGESEDDFDKPSAEPLVRMFKNRNVSVYHNVTKQPPAPPSSENIASENTASENTAEESERPKDKKMTLDLSMYEADETPAMTPVKPADSFPGSLPVNGKSKEPFPEERSRVKDLFSCMKEIEILFVKASDSGKEVPRMLEADKVHCRPLLPEEIAHRSKPSSFLTAFFACCREDVPLPQPPPQAEIKYLTWHRSVSSHSSSSRNPLGLASKDNIDDLTGNIFSGIYMNAGSHASTLDRLYAWERKLYDEVKASGAIRREYDIKRRLLRNQESRIENRYRIDRTRAAVKDLHSRILVAIQRIDFVSKNIEELRDKELQPQLEELIGSLTKMWATMFECHRHQHEIIKLVSHNGNMKVSIRSESQRQAALVLTVELNTLSSNFQKWRSSHKSYLRSLNAWLHKCVQPLKQKGRRKSTPESLRNHPIAPMFATCEEWIKLLGESPTKEKNVDESPTKEKNVIDAIRGLAAETNHFLPRLEKRHSTSKLSFSLSRSGALNGAGTGEEFPRDDAPVDLQSSLEAFLQQLEAFSKDSLQKYEKLQTEIDIAKKFHVTGYR